MAFRSVPRPSSPPGAKASTERPSLALSYANIKPKLRVPILHRNHPTLFAECRTYPHPRAPTRTSSMSSLLCRPIPHSCENNRVAETDAPSSTSILFTLLNTLRLRGLGSLLTILLRSDLQPARPDAPNPDSHVKRTKDQPSKEDQPAPARPLPGHLLRRLRSMLTRSAFPPRRRLSLWRWTVSNRRPPACKAGALPLSYTPRRHNRNESLWFFPHPVRVKKEQRLFCKKKQKLPFLPVRTIQHGGTPLSRMTHHRSLVGQGGFEPPTPRLSSVCSNQLSYWPKYPKRIGHASTKGQKRAQATRLVAGKGYVDGAQSGSA